MGVRVQEWIDVLRREYLEDFVSNGGAAVKFALVSDGIAPSTVSSEIHRHALACGYLAAEVDAGRVKVHLMHQLFHEIARQVPWEDLARRVVRQCYADQGFEVAEDDLRFNQVAKAYGVEPGPLGMEMRRRLETVLDLSSALAKDFRYAMLWLCKELLVSRERTPQVEVILSWLHGDLRLVAGIKKLLIFRKIGRHNARAMLSSLGAWCRLAGLPGIVLVLHLQQLAIAKRADVPPDKVHYGTAAVMDAYEVLRQLIDATDDLSGVLCVVTAPPQLFEDEKRGVKVYKALYERVWPDVRLRRKPNPLSALTNLEVASWS